MQLVAIDNQIGEDSPSELRAFAGRMNALPKLVFSTTLTGDPGWNGKLAGDDIAGEIARLKAEPGKDLFRRGGAGLAAAFIERDLVDRYRLMIEPTLLGDGVPLFKGGHDRRRLKLVGAQPLDTGAVILTYERGAPE